MADAPEPDQDRRIESLVDRLQVDLVDDEGVGADRQLVAEVVTDAASKFDGAPVQDFVPLLVEHHAREALADEGLHRVLPNEAEAPAPSLDDAEHTPPAP